MIIAHLPAGYIFSKLLTRKLADKDFDLSNGELRELRGHNT